MKVIKLKKLNELAQIPQQATENDGGWDVVVTEIEQVSEDFVICKLGFALELPKGHKLTLVPRSSLTKTKWILQNSPGLGDWGYRSDYQYRFRALPESIKFNFKKFRFEIKYPEFPYKVGDRIGQVYLETVIPTKFEIVEELSETERKGGYGSTGK